jgi:hypothetical protein
MMSKKVGGVPVPILVVGGVVVAVLIYRKLKGSTSSTTSTGTTAAGDTTGTTSDQGTGYSGGGYSGDGSGGGNGGYSSLLAQIAALQTTQSSHTANITQQANSKEAQIKALQNKLNSIKGTGSTATSKTKVASGVSTGGHYETSGAPAPVSTKPTAQAIKLGDLKSTGITQKASTPAPAKTPAKATTAKSTLAPNIK